jgi:hypothetical protein
MRASRVVCLSFTLFCKAFVIDVKLKLYRSNKLFISPLNQICPRSLSRFPVANLKRGGIHLI